jgi:hypothetical protein
VGLTGGHSKDVVRLDIWDLSWPLEVMCSMRFVNIASVGKSLGDWDCLAEVLEVFLKKYH